MAPNPQPAAPALIARLLKWRYLKFGVVGAAGTLVNLVVLYIGQEHLFRSIPVPGTRLYCSLALAILIATVHNFAINRLWTWRDRTRQPGKTVLAEFGQYALACWVGIALQVLFTKTLAAHMNYLAANLIAVALASVFNYVVNDIWTFRIAREDPRSAAAPALSALCCLAALLGIFVYFFGLDGQHIPKNGDENPYINITRMTAASGHWLPLESSIAEMRNTKPPLLFWQGIVSTDRGRNWTLWALRWPSVVYTLLTSGLVFLVALRYSRQVAAGALAALAYLAFFSTYRYGRPFLTNAPETFWLFAAYFPLLYWSDWARESRWLPPLLGLMTGVALLYKSFALLAPAGLAIAWWYLYQRGYRWRDFLVRDSWKLAVLGVVALLVFSAWFALDPEPAAVWREFVLKENLGKFDAAGGSYVRNLLWGGSSLWTMAFGVAANAGLLALPVLALMAAALRDRGRLRAEDRALWIWVLALMIAFSLPSQRSIRYLLAAMPAVAVLCALGWQRLSRVWFVVTLLIAEFALGLLAYESWLLQVATSDGELFPVFFWLLLLLSLGFGAAALAIPALTRPGTPVAALLVLLAIAAFLEPFDGARGSYSAEAQRRVAGREVWVPSGFADTEEAYRFMLRGADIHSYVAQRDQDPEALARRYRLFAVRVPLDEAPCTGCRVLAQRLDLRGRISSADLGELLRGRVFATVFLKELLVESTLIDSPQSGG